MKIILNSEERIVPEGHTVRDLLEALGLAGRPVAVERNREIVPYQTFSNAILQDGDVLELVTLVGGG